MTGLAILLKPLVALLLLGLVVLPLKLLFVRFFPSGKLKRWLLRELEQPDRRGNNG